MTLTEQISLIDSMIRENPDYTIRDYQDLMKELNAVSDSLKHTFIFHQSIIEYGITATHRKAYPALRFYSR